MFSIINSLPTPAFIGLLLVGEISIIYCLITRKVKNDKTLNCFLILLLVVGIFIAIDKIASEYFSGGIIDELSDKYSLYFTFVFPIGLIILSLKKIKSDDTPIEIKNTLKFALIAICFLVCILVLIKVI